MRTIKVICLLGVKMAVVSGHLGKPRIGTIGAESNRREALEAKFKLMERRRYSSLP